jgi:ubiquinone/menaquinone biosynthesis C-methylase UbiE
MTPNESAAWHQNYASEAAIARRRKEIVHKLARLGIDGAPRNSIIVDACCGHGETLSALYDLGFRHLHGIDLTVPPGLDADTRFVVRTGDATSLDFADASVDWVVCIHSLHHLASVDNVEKFVAEAYRVLKPGGRLSIIDFPGSLQIKVAFWFFRQNAFLVTPYLKWFGSIVQEEWWFLKTYLPQWPHVRRVLWRGPFEVERQDNRLFYYYVTLRKPVVGASDALVP